jgi:small subunit ribosomal protein S6
VKQYELVVLLHPDLEIDVDAPISKIESIINGIGGTVTKRDNWGKKRLAYVVKKQQFGIYVYMEIELGPEAVRQLESQLLITEEVIRFLLVNRIVTPPRPEKAETGDQKLTPAEGAEKEK